jgi:hypothetical protein
MELKQNNQRKEGYSQGRQKMIQIPLLCHLLTLTDANSGAGTSYPSGALGFKYCVLALK